MGWQVGYDSNWQRDVGYGVPAICDQPGCGEKIDRGLGYVCGAEPYGGEHGCGLFFCGEHMFCSDESYQACERCRDGQPPFDATPDTREWVEWKLADESWGQWRDENPEAVSAMREGLDTGKHEAYASERIP
jgi:hypothetical protein